MVVPGSAVPCTNGCRLAPGSAGTTNSTVGRWERKLTELVEQPEMLVPSVSVAQMVKLVPPVTLAGMPVVAKTVSLAAVPTGKVQLLSEKSCTMVPGSAEPRIFGVVLLPGEIGSE